MAVDITINETIDVVDITVNPNIIEVNVTRTSGGGGGSQTLAQTLDNGNSTGGENIVINNADAIELENTSLLKKGTYDFGGNGGISRICSNQYEDMWQNGFRHVFDQSGFIRNSSNGFDLVPDSSFDVTLRFKVGSFWTLDNGTTYICTDATEGAAEWELYSVGATPTLQQVTDKGNTTDNDITVSKETGTSFIQLVSNNNTLTLQVNDASGSYIELNDSDNNNYGALSCAELVMTKNDSGENVQLNSNYLLIQNSNSKPLIELQGSDGTLTGSVQIKSDLIDGTYEQQLPDKSGTFAMLDDIPSGGGTVTSVDLSMPSAFTVTNNPVTTSGTLTVTGAGAVSQYVRGDGTLANFPASSGGGSSLSFYLNGSVSQGTIGGVAFREMDRTPILGAGTDFTINANGYIQSFITDAGVPNQLEIPAGNWNFETYFSASSGGGSPSFYIELYKWNGTTLSLIASNSSSPRLITDGTNIEAYFSALAVPQTTLLATDRLAVRIYVTHSGRTITLHTENSHLCQVITTFSTGLTALNGLTAQVQNFAVGTSGTDFAISSATETHTFNLPTASALNRGALSSADWTTFNNKQNDFSTFQRKQGIIFFDDFLGTNDNAGIATSTGVTMSGVGTGSITRITGVYPNRTNQQGVIQLATGTLITGNASYRLGSVNTPTFFVGSGAISYEILINIETLSTLANRFVNVFGLYTGSSITTSNNLISFIYDEGGVFASGGIGASPNWKCVTGNAGTRTSTDSTIAVTASAWTKLRIEINANATSVGFYINDTLVATHTTNIPATTTAMYFLNGMQKTTGLTSVNMYADYLSFKQTFTTER